MDISQYSVEDFVCDEGFQLYCTGENPAQVLFWEQWAAEHPLQAADMQTARNLVNVLNAGQGNRLAQLQQLRQGIQQSNRLHEALANVTSQSASQQTASTQQNTLKQSAPRPAARSSKRVLRYVGAAAFLAIGFTAARLFINRSTAPQSPAAFINSSTIYAAGDALRKTVVLPDGTVMTLRSQSKATLDAGFNDAHRGLTLEGEAFFDVKHEAAHPFIVHTKQVEITVLGTVFNVSAYPANGTTETSLFRGQVSVMLTGGGSKPIILEPNQKLIVGDATMSAAKQPATAGVRVQPLAADPVNHKAKEIAWVRNRLEIENEPLVTIAAKLEKWYGIPVVFADPAVQQYRYSGTFESETIIKALEALQLSYPFSFRMEHDKIVISK